MARVSKSPKGDSHVVLLHPFDKNPKEEGTPGLTAEFGDFKKEYRVKDFAGTSHKAGWVFDLAVARDPDGAYWYKAWGQKNWTQFAKTEDIR